MVKKEVERRLYEYVFNNILKSKRLRDFTIANPNYWFSASKQYMNFEATYIPTDHRVKVALIRHEEDDIVSTTAQFIYGEATKSEIKSVLFLLEYLENKIPREELINHFEQMVRFRYAYGRMPE